MCGKIVLYHENSSCATLFEHDLQSTGKTCTAPKRILASRAAWRSVHEVLTLAPRAFQRYPKHFAQKSVLGLSLLLAYFWLPLALDLGQMVLDVRKM